MFDKFQNTYIKEEEIMFIKADLQLNLITVGVCFSSEAKIFKYKNNEELLKDMQYFKDEEEWTPFDKLDDLIYVNCYYLCQFFIDKDYDKDVLILDFKPENTLSKISLYVNDINLSVREFINDLIN